MRLTFFTAVFSDVLLGCVTVCQAATISYSGRVYDEMGQPLIGGYVVAGTFAPSFDPSRYSCFYGDNACNLGSQAYDRAVADGNFVPAGPGGFTGVTGLFTLAGDSTAAGSPVWLFAFEDEGRDSFFQALATSGAANWLVPTGSGSTTLSAVQADRFVLGGDHPNGIQLSVVPFPEPGAFVWLAMVAKALLGGRRGR